jgi:hypothetical protein
MSWIICFPFITKCTQALESYQADGMNTFADGSNILADFMTCMYEIEDEAEFEVTFSSMRSKVRTQNWLYSIYNVKDKWAECYMRSVFTLGMRSTQLSEAKHVVVSYLREVVYHAAT